MVPEDQVQAVPVEEMQAPGLPVVKYQGVEYPLATELTEREKYEAERITSRSLFELEGYTLALLLAFFTLKRTGYQPDFDYFLDSSGFELAEAVPPLAPSGDHSLDGVNNGAPTEPDGSPVSPPLSESIPG